MTLRQLPGATVLGLVVALATHAVLFGGEHAWGGAYHSAFLQLTLAAVTGLMAATGALLWSGARCAADGTVLAARIRPMLPGWGAIAVSGAGWFVVGERLETAHAHVPFVAIVAILAVTAWVVFQFASAALRVLVRIVFSVANALDAPCHPEPVEGQVKPNASPHHAQRDTIWRARLLRAPPVRLALTRA